MAYGPQTNGVPYAAGSLSADASAGVAANKRLHPVRARKAWPYEKATRIGMMAMVGGKDKTKIRNATPIEFRDLLLSMVAPKPARQNAV